MPMPNHPDPQISRLDRWAPWAIALTAAVGRLPALGGWWALDDWGQLGRAAGVAGQTAGLPARILSQHLWWDLLWPLTGMAPHPQTLLRMLIHAACAGLVARIGRRCGLPFQGWVAAGLIFAASPLAFTPLYWASGIQELLAALGALLAVDRWLAGTRKALLAGFAAALFSILAKESGFGLPVFFLAVLWWGEAIPPRDRAFAWGLIMLTLAVVVAEGVLVLTHFATGAGDPYALGGFLAVMGNLGTFGWWLLTPGPVFASHISGGMAGAGMAVFLLWFLWAGFRLPTGDPVPAAALLAALLILAPALPLRTQIHPYLAYLAAAPLILALATLVPWSRVPLLAVAALAVGTAMWSTAGMEIRLQRRNDLGLPADPVIRATSLSWSARQSIRAAAGAMALTDDGSSTGIILYAPPATPAAAERAAPMGPDWVEPDELFLACGGRIGPVLMAPDGATVVWRSALDTSSASAQVLAATATGFKVWGPVPNALLYAAVTDVALGRFERARRHLTAAAALNPSVAGFVYDAGQMIVPVQLAEKNLQPFIDWTVSRLDAGTGRREVGGLQSLFFSVMSVCTGKPVSALQDGSTVLIPGGEQKHLLGENPRK